MSFKFQVFGLEAEHYETSSEILGGKGAGLVHMYQDGLNVPPGFVIPTMLWAEYDKSPVQTMKEIAKTLPVYLTQLKDHFGYMPLLSVRSGARVSCPGMMDTILNVGIDPSNFTFWTDKLGKDCFLNSLHRLVTMYGSVVKGIDRKELENAGLEGASKLYKEITGEKFPDFSSQLLGAIEAVFKSWDNDRAITYRKVEGIPREWGTAVTIQAMVFGNLNLQSGSGVVFTRNCDTGESTITGDFLPNAQGEDVVAGTVTPLSISNLMKGDDTTFKANFIELFAAIKGLEKKRKDVQDVEFTIQDGKLYFLQTRTAKRTAQAAIRIAVEMQAEGLLTKLEAVRRVTPKMYDEALLSTIDTTFKVPPVFMGIDACSGVVTGKPVFSSFDAINCKVPCILVTEETTPNDLAGMLASKGLITMKGGKTSHAALVARSYNLPCICGVGQSLEVFKEQDIISMDGATGRIWFEAIPITSGVKNAFYHQFAKLIVEAAGVVPIIGEVRVGGYDTPEFSSKEAMFSIGALAMNPAKAALRIKYAAEKVDTLYVDCTIAEGAESSFFSICKSFNPMQKVVDVLQDWCDSEKQIGSSLKKKLVFFGDVDFKGFKVLGNASLSLESLVLADSEIVLNETLTNSVAAKKVIEWKKKEGATFVAVGTIIKDVKSMLSVEQAFRHVGDN